MEITCPKCATVFQLNEALLPPEGGWVRCTRCQEVFLAERAAPQLDVPPAPQDEPELTRGAPPSLEQGPIANFGLGDEDEEINRPRQGRVSHFFFFLFMLVLILSALGTGGLVALDRLKLMPHLVAPFRDLPLLNLLLSQSTAPEGGLSLNNVRGYYRDNQHVGRILVIQGDVLNTSDRTLVQVLVMGRVNDIHNNPARQITICAGPVFTPDQLRSLTLNELQTYLSQPQDHSGALYVLPPRGSLPFMIVLANLPDNISDYTVDVVGWEDLP
jgi:predicted Zn finger-like uncharacterized protein